MSGRRRSGGHEEAHENAERWLLTYADMITLLLALFIILFAMSNLSIKKFKEFENGLVVGAKPPVVPASGGGSGLLHQTSLVSHPGITHPSNYSISITPPSPMAVLQAKLQAALARQGLSSDAQITRDSQSVTVKILSDKVFFATGSAELGAVGNRIVDTVGSIIAGLPNYGSVQGYTDNQPIIGGPYTSNFELSAVRAISVVERLVRVDHFDPARISGTGFGSERPIVPNTTPQGQAANRRVDVVILSTSPSAATPQPAKPAASSSGSAPASPQLAAQHSPPATSKSSDIHPATGKGTVAATRIK